MSQRTCRRALPALALALGLLFPPSAAPAADDGSAEVTAFVITTWDGDCDGNDVGDWDNMVRAWYNEMRDADAPPNGHGMGAYAIGWLNNNNWIVESQFCDPGVVGWGDDVNYLDVPDAFMAGFHGGNDSGDHRWIGWMKYDEDGSGNCFLYQGNVRAGDGDLEFLHLSSCFSMDREDWWNEWNSSFDGLHEIDGFHGIMWIDSDYASDYRRFADDAFWMSIADSWLDHMYQSPWVRADQCPVARVVGFDQADAIDRLNHEGYIDVYADPPGYPPGMARSHRARYINGCTPEGKEEL
jgi:hypothetical protein